MRRKRNLYYPYHGGKRPQIKGMNNYHDSHGGMSNILIEELNPAALEMPAVYKVFRAMMVLSMAVENR